MTRPGWVVGPAAALLLAPAATAAAGPRITIECQKNLATGRVTVDGTKLSDDARFRVVSFQEYGNRGGWAYGDCVIELTRGRRL